MDRIFKEMLPTEELNNLPVIQLQIYLREFGEAVVIEDGRITAVEEL